MRFLRSVRQHTGVIASACDKKIPRPVENHGGCFLYKGCCVQQVVPSTGITYWLETRMDARFFLFFLRKYRKKYRF